MMVAKNIRARVTETAGTWWRIGILREMINLSGMEERFDLTEWVRFMTFVVEASTLRVSPLMLRRKGLCPINSCIKCSLLIEMQDGGACFGIMAK